MDLSVLDRNLQQPHGADCWSWPVFRGIPVDTFGIGPKWCDLEDKIKTNYSGLLIQITRKNLAPKRGEAVARKVIWGLRLPSVIVGIGVDSTGRGQNIDRNIGHHVTSFASQIDVAVAGNLG